MASVNKTASVTFPPTLVKPTERNAVPVGGNPDICGRLWGHLTIIGENKMSKLISNSNSYSQTLNRIATALTRDPFKSSFLDFDLKFYDMATSMDKILNYWDSFTAEDAPNKVNHPMNIIKDDNVTTIELALAGFKKEEITVEDVYTGDIRTLLITGTTDKDTKSSDADSQAVSRYSHRQISRRDFVKTFNLTKTSTIESVTYENGILTVKIAEPKEDEPTETVKRININID